MVPKVVKERAVVLAVCLTLSAVVVPAGGRPVLAQEKAAADQAVEQEPQVVAEKSFGLYASVCLSVAICVGLACLAAGYAVGRVGAAALGAAAEKPEMLGRSLIFVGLAEGIAIYGLIIGIMLLGELPG